MSFLEQRKNEYFLEILNILKGLANHELYMEKIRQQLCDSQYFDPFTAYKFIDSFKHNNVIAFDLKGFLQLFSFSVTIQQCTQVIQALNKSQDSLTYDRYLQMIMPYDITKRNRSLNRFNQIKVQVGTYQQLNEIKAQSKKIIFSFFQKQVLFVRQFTHLKQNFCRQWGADVYTILQSMFKNIVNSEQKQKISKNPLFNYDCKNKLHSSMSQINEIGFQNFYQFCRKFKVYFNKNQFKAIWRRIKTVQETIKLKVQQISLKNQDLVSVLITKNFNTKKKFASPYQIPSQLLVQRLPSYKVKNQREIHNSYQYRKNKQNQEFKKKTLQLNKQLTYPNQNIKYKYSYPQSHYLGWKLKQKQLDWLQTVNKMSQTHIQERYHQIQKNKKLFEK